MFGNLKHKYIKLNMTGNFIFFPMHIQHSEFNYLKPVSAGFCYFKDNKIDCFGESVSLKLSSLKEDSEQATFQVFGLNSNNNE